MAAFDRIHRLRAERCNGRQSGRLQLARLGAAHGDYNEAILAYRSLLSRSPSQAQYREASAELARLERKHPAASHDPGLASSNIPARAPSSSTALLVRDTDSVFAAGKFPEAERAYLQIVNADPANGHVQDNIADIDKTATYRQRIQLLRGMGSGDSRYFEDVGGRAGEPFSRGIVGRGLSTGDYDNDGRIDVLVVDSEGAPLLLHNESQNANH